MVNTDIVVCSVSETLAYKACRLRNDRAAHEKKGRVDKVLATAHTRSITGHNARRQKTTVRCARPLHV